MLKICKNPDITTATRLIEDIAERRSIPVPRVIDKPLVLYGAGNLGKLAKEYFDFCGIPVSCVVDAHARQARANPCWNGVHVTYPSDVSEIEKKNSLVAVCISTSPYEPIRNHLTEQGWYDIVPFYDIVEAYRDRHPLANGWFAGNLTQGDVTAMQQVATGWDDSISRAHYLQFLAWRKLREEWVFSEAPVTIHDRYFIPRITSLFHEHESFLDVGAHFGEVSIRFSEQVKDTFRHIIAIEPDPANLMRLKDNFSKKFNDNQHGRITILDHVLDEHPGVCLFCDRLDYASQISLLGKRQAPLKTLDELALEPSFIKLHLEGRELAVLKGGQETLIRFRPIVAATAYHNRFDLWENFQWMMNNLSDYRFLLRLHGWCGTGLVVYAVPAERSANVHNQLH